MRSRIARFVAVAFCLVAPLGWTTFAQAATTATVTVTGEVVDISMSFTLSSNTFSFGDIDKTGDSYNAGTSPSQPFPVTTNAFGIPEGTAWFAKTPIVATVTTPVTVIIRSCLTAQTNVIDGAGTRIFTGPFAGTEGAAADLLGSTRSPLCTDGASGVHSIYPGVSQLYNIYPVYLVRATDSPTTFSATIQLSLAAFG